MHSSHYPSQITGPPLRRTALEDKALQSYLERNQSFEKCVVYYLTKNGFFAEYHDLVMVMIWAWQKGYQFVLDSSRFLYGPDEGWCDYFEPFCRNADEINPTQVVKGFEFNPKGRSTFNTQILRSHRPESVYIGEVKLTGYDVILDFFKRMIFRLNGRCTSEVILLLNAIELPVNYLAVQIRRGDKIGEDIYYPVDLYLSRLGNISDQDTIFVMTDDYRTVEEVQDWLEVRGLGTRMITLCEKRERGFNICDMREGKTFTRGLKPHKETMGENSLIQHTDRLLAEMLITSGAGRLATTRISYLGMALRALRGKSENVSMLERDDVASFSPPKLPDCRHILDAYTKVLLIQPGSDNTHFFSCILSALNQIIYCTNQGYLPVIDFNANNCSQFHDPEQGDDIWSYFFEPVAGYTAEDIRIKIEDPEECLQAKDVITLSNTQIEEICKFNIDSISHYPMGYWQGNPPESLYEWYKNMRIRGHVITSRYIAVKPGIQSEVSAFEEKHMTGKRVLGVHVRNSDAAEAPPVSLDLLIQEIDSKLEHPTFDKIFLATDKLHYLAVLNQRYEDKLITRKYPYFGDDDSSSNLQNSSVTERGKQALIDALLLARCNWLVHGPSRLTEFVHYLKPLNWPPLPIMETRKS